VITEQTKQINFKKEHFSTLPQEIQSIISGLLDLDISKRMNICQLITHPLMENAS
jgi:hypothetical protein